MIYDVYEEVPLMLFFKISKDESKKHLLRNGDKATNKEINAIWESHKDKWDERHPSSDWVKQRQLVNKSMKLSWEIKQKHFFIKFLLTSDLMPDKEVFEAADEPYDKDLVKVCERINKTIKKKANQLEIYEAQLKNLRESIGNKNPVEKEESSITEALASLQIASGLSFKYSEITIGEYEGINKALERKHELLKQNNGKR